MMEQWMIEALDEYYKNEENLREAHEYEEHQSHNPEQCFCTEHWG